MSQKYEKLKGLLRELFQLDQPDLDFGIYRILHARAEEVTRFLDQDLLPQVKAAFAQYQLADKATLEEELAEAIKQARALDADPETLPKVKKLRTRLAEAAVDLEALEAEVYDHLYRFFRRYYSEGDFLSRRVYRPGVYAIPYEGEEVKLHWANADQYYIKTSEYLRDYTFRLRPEDWQNPMRVHFRLVDAAEGEHGNVKEQAGKERRFKLAAENFATVEDGELVIRFTYAPDPAKQKELNTAAEKAILSLGDPSLSGWVRLLSARHVRADGTLSEATRLRVHLDRYTARNTFDYFIHKDLGGFLRRELDFYIKNEVMHLDDVESESAPRVEQYLSKIKVIRRIAHKIIDFLSQLEDFQKKLWLKKKFVVETQYCVTLDRIFAIQDEIMRQELIHEIIENDAQREEWVRLFAIDEISVDLTKPGYSSPLTTEFLKANPYLALDTRHFPEDFKLRLLASFDDLDRQCDGLLIHSENFQALSLLRGRYYQQICCVYNDPPYNTEADRSSGKFLYKDGYERSSWISFLYDRIHQTLPLLADDALFLVSIDEHEFGRLNELLGRLLQTRVGVFTWVKKAKGSHLSQTIRDMTEFVLAYCRVKDGLVLYGEAAYSEKTQPLAKKTNARKTLKFPPRCVSTKLADGKYQAGKRGEGDSALTFIEPFEVANGIVTTKIVVEGPFVWTQEKLCKELKLGTIPLLSSQFGFNVMRHDQAKKFKRPSTLLSSEQGIGTNETAFQEYASLFGIEPRGLYPKPVSLISYLIQARTFFSKEGLILDAFAGSGSTAHAVINLNREDSGQRKYILVEMGEYFDTVLVPRIKKAVYSKDWKDGKPVSRAGISHMFKYVRLESYEDTLNNLELRRTQVQQSLLDHPQAQGPDRLKEQYLLRYMLDVESRGSPSLLNVKAFDDPTAYAFKVKRPGSDESRVMNVDLIETFNWLIGLRVQHLAAP